MLGFFDALILLAESSPDIYIKGADISAFGEIDLPKSELFLKISPNIREKSFVIGR
jgi:hypothetical protein